MVALLALAACGDSSTSKVSGDEHPAATNTGQLAASCGGVEFDSVPADPSTFEPADGVWNEIDLTEIGMEAEFFDFYDWSIASQTAQELTLFGQPIEPSEGGPQLGAASFERDADEWTPTSWGQCRIELTAPGFGPARFVLDPDHEPDPGDTTVAVLATEMACTGGEAPGGRDVRALVVAEDEASVSIVVLVEPPTGDNACPGETVVPSRGRL